MKLFKLFFIFLVINFSALALGSWLMNNGPTTDWYKDLNQAPWTPYGWVFGVAWTTIMICFSVYMAYLYIAGIPFKIHVLFGVQYFLNVIWNYAFFNQHQTGLGLLIIVALTVIVGVFLFGFKKQLKIKSLLIAPYFVWLCIATSLNAYIFFNN